MLQSVYINEIARSLGIGKNQVHAVIKLMEEKATVPFIARYRKERTGNLDEVAIIAIRDTSTYFGELEKRKEFILSTINGQGSLTPELESSIKSTLSSNELEDLYLPYKPKRKTRADTARGKGLEPLAVWLLKQMNADPRQKAIELTDANPEVLSPEDALSGARDIIAELINLDVNLRNKLRRQFRQFAVISSSVKKGKEHEGRVYKQYFDWKEKAAAAPSHRILAIFRGADQGILKVSVLPDQEKALSLIRDAYIKVGFDTSKQVDIAVVEAYKRLLSPSLENEVKKELKEQADREAIQVFSSNLRELLLESPLGQKPIIALDPGLRTGCKVAALNAQGALLEHTTIYPLPPKSDTEKAAKVLIDLCDKHNAAIIAVGNGTGGRVAEAFCNTLNSGKKVSVIMVNESGASVYSASKAARDEFPNHDVTVRGAVSIGRRLMDPLAELVKIDPKSIGVGQYQHDVDQKLLKKALDDVVSSCVNTIGVEINTASTQLLQYVSGLTPAMAKSIVRKRETQGPFKTRRELVSVKNVGDKSFEQSAGFLRISNADNPLDTSAVHPENYSIVERMASDQDCSVSDLMLDALKRKAVTLSDYVSGDAGMPTLKDIMRELEKPGRDPREEFKLFSFAEHIHDIEDLHPGMIIPGIVTNVTQFGAFVDIGVHQDGLVHISELSGHYVKVPMNEVKVKQKVMVKVLSVDPQRRRIGLSMKQAAV